MSPENPNEKMSLSERLAKWFDSPAGQASLANMKEEHEREERAKERFANRIKSMSLEEQDEWMEKIIARYSSKEYSDRWYERGILPPHWLYDRIFEFISENGIIVDEINDEWSKSPVWQYNHWKVDVVYGQGEACYNFVKTLEEAHPYGDNIFYVIRDSSCKIHMLDNIVCKKWQDANDIIVEFVKLCKKNGIENVDEKMFRISRSDMQTVSEITSKLAKIIGEGILV